MLMDIFYDTPPTRIAYKRRVHFHAFILDVHKRMHAAKAAGAGDPLLPVARDLANEAHVLCLDEFQVTDIADAMILRWLLDTLLEHGVVCVFTSKCVVTTCCVGVYRRSSFKVATRMTCTRMASNVLLSFPRLTFSRHNSTSRDLIRAQVCHLNSRLPLSHV